MNERTLNEIIKEKEWLVKKMGTFIKDNPEKMNMTFLDYIQRLTPEIEILKQIRAGEMKVWNNIKDNSESNDRKLDNHIGYQSGEQ